MAKHILVYWQGILSEAWVEMWERLGILGLLFGLLLSGAYTLVVGEQAFSLLLV
jgi:hypothetical protein